MEGVLKSGIPKERRFTAIYLGVTLGANGSLGQERMEAAWVATISTTTQPMIPNPQDVSRTTNLGIIRGRIISASRLLLVGWDSIRLGQALPRKLRITT